ncbi:alpha/beta fold hydrolase [Marinobacter sp. SS21]|uniref:alpha/beta fold hydrolase n=1 Tax=Marinobacter sp. SS21 TaxID=2979460 RepID=UPI00232C0703|nr:alpha/beta fold hydrolase [Marinobacter sp. SS21]MDC0662687.1 alpha/beta fold hydrolase [Marinobacter sp. SS21]
MSQQGSTGAGSKACVPVSRQAEDMDQLHGPNAFIGLNRRGLLSTTEMLLQQVRSKPNTTWKRVTSFGNQFKDIINGRSELAPDKKDKRFEDVTWQENGLYRKALQTYLAASMEINQWLDDIDINDHDRSRANYLLSLAIDALSPSNLPTNPVAIKRAIETGGASAVQGVRNLWDDFRNNGSLPLQVDKSRFRLGENVARTPGKVVYRHAMFELIQYLPQSEKVREKPLLISPPQINKFYIFDLSERASLVDHYLKAGFQVFIVSWRNPDKKFAYWGLESYVEALESAVDVTCAISETESCNVMGGCSGGITLSVLVGYLAAKKKSTINSLTLLVCILDPSAETSLGLFASGEAIDYARKYSQKKGVLSGNDFARTFSWLRPNDLIWNYWVNNYLLGKKPPAFDILFWNCDTTNIPAQLHSDFLDLFVHDDQIAKGKMKIGGYAIDLQEINVDLFSVAGVTDHITPWQGCYQTANLFGGRKTFVLSNSGHIQSILNPPGNPKAKFFVNDEMPPSPTQWKAEANLQEGSWWASWEAWLNQRSGELVEAKSQLGNNHFQPLEDAPGSYVMKGYKATRKDNG